MCGTCATGDELSEVARARRFADVLAADLLRLPVEKAMELGTPQGFDRAVASLAAELRRQAGRPERDAVRAAVTSLMSIGEAPRPSNADGSCLRR